MARVRAFSTALLVTIVVFALTRDVEFALTLLVIACPDALITSGEGLERLAAVDTLFLDKRGTLPRGRLILVHVGVAQAGTTHPNPCA